MDIYYYLVLAIIRFFFAIQKTREIAQVSNAPFVQAADDFLYQREALDSALIFQTETELDQSLYYIIGNYEMRVLVISLDETDRDPYQRLVDLRPVPTAFVAFGTAEDLSAIISKAAKMNLIK